MAGTRRVLMGGLVGLKDTGTLKSYITAEYPDVSLEWYGEIPIPEDELIEKARDAEVLFSVYQKMSDHTYDSLPNLKAYVSMSMGYDAANADAATRHGVLITHNPDYCVDEVGSHTVSLILACQRGLFTIVPWVKEGNWGFIPLRPKKRFAGSVVGLYGFGRIGQDVARKLSGFSVRLIAYDPYVDANVPNDLQVDLVDFDEMVETADFVSLHAPLTPATRGVFNQDVFKKMKHSAYLINAARGPLVDTDSLFKALEEKWIAGAALDVLDNEPPKDSDKKLIALPNVIVTGHSAFYSDTALDESMRRSANEVGRILRGEKPRCPANKEVLSKIDWFVE